MRQPYQGTAIQEAPPPEDDTAHAGRGSDVELAWEVLKKLARKASAGCTEAYQPPAHTSADAAQLLDLMLPLCVGERAPTFVVAHLGQSLDGRVATHTGASKFITGPEDLRHTHRLRALFDAVLVGAETVMHDDPRLTTRLVTGESPTRVVLDPRARLDRRSKVFVDGAADTLWVVGQDALVSCPADHVDVVAVRMVGPSFDLGDLLACLRDRGLPRVFIEGGGVTVSRFITEGLVDRLHLTVAPRIIGSGTPALCLPPADRLSDTLHVNSRCVQLGQDMLFDCDMRAA